MVVTERVLLGRKQQKEWWLLFLLLAFAEYFNQGAYRPNKLL